ncbi:hypothetical protein JVT61DRAFT_13129 [Boletus reticuloceps]|uniref:FYVE-type domain-containing protein n=1 Tax=Boletus reticuloceps TaxID=495285 RepID=A0A8I2YT72_9AGAM|nr:hypothetical protein JVT61DRAFT_13129 [Boletus reticuloceps]
MANQESTLSDTRPSLSSLPESEDDDEVFTYPADDYVHDGEEFVYPDASTDTTQHQDSLIVSIYPLKAEPSLDSAVESATLVETAPSLPFPLPRTQVPSRPSPAQLEALSAAASQGDLALLKKLFDTALQSGDLEAFALANHASSRTGFTALHAAASRGYLDIVKWLVENCGAMPDLEDREGETALHKAALNGHMLIIQYLLANRADIHARDADGWTALHNACSKGYLDIVRWLCESGGAATEVGRVRGVDLRNKGGWTPLMNAASKGHLPVVTYLLSKQAADSLVRNNWGETAYDVAASVFEVWICEILQKTEVERWRGTTAPYNPLRVHTTFQGDGQSFPHLDLEHAVVPAPFELKLPSPDEDTGAKLVASYHNDVQLPLASDPYVLPNASRRDTPILDGAERSHFWLSDWVVDDTHPRVSPDGGWQYAQSFSAPDEVWLPEPPSQLARLLSGTGLVAVGLASPSRNYEYGSSSSSSVLSNTNTWVRRRRWVRVMRRKVFPLLPFMEPDGSMYDLAHDGSLIPHVNDGDREEGEEGQELGPMRPNPLSSAQDYVARARYLVGYRSESNDEARSAVEARRTIAKLERATSELRQGILSDNDRERKIQAEVLLNAYGRELERCRLSAGAQGLLNSSSEDEFNDDDDGDDDDDNHDEVFRYPGYSPLTIHTPSVEPGSTEHCSRPTITRDLTPDLSQAPEFRVPTREAPQKMTLSPHVQWERDDAVQACNDCQRRFSFILRRHCRRCGRIFCDRCSCHRVALEPSEIVQDPTTPVTTATSSSQRVCQSCFDQRNANTPARVSSAVERIVVDRGRLMAPGQLTRQNSSSQLSDLADCPVCGTNLSAFESPETQEAHVKGCLDGGTRSAPQTVKYLVYELPAESALVGVECVICLEEFTQGSAVARLSCFCSFHNGENLKWSPKRTQLMSTHSMPIILVATWPQLSCSYTLTCRMWRRFPYGSSGAHCPDYNPYIKMQYKL